MKFTTSKIFVDTNILIYTVQEAEPEKKAKCEKALRQLAENKSGVISTQVLQEFFTVATKKLAIDALIVKSFLHSFENFEIVRIDVPHIKDAIDCSILNRISFWDALIVVSAESAKCEKIWTEDLHHGQIINGVQIEHIVKN